jgi:cytochrome c oxidase subunit 2
MKLRNSGLVKALLGVPILLALGACATDAPLDSLNPKGPEADAIQNLVVPVFAIAAVVFVLVEFGVLFLAIKFRRRKDDDSLPVQHHGNFKLEIGWTILPALVLAGVGAASVFTLFDLADTPADAQEVTVIGQQWWWEYRYDVDGDGEDDIITANDLVIPVGQPIALTIQSRDVIHSFWIPALNGKRDAVPGRAQPLTIEADEPGVYRGQCSEFCGLSHSYMRMRVVALAAADYKTWQDNQLTGADVPQEALAKKGLEQFRISCSGCHLASGPGGDADIYKGTAQVSGAAPNLTHFASRGVFAGSIFDLWLDTNVNGEVDTEEIGKIFNVADVKKWLRNPPAEKPMYPQGGRGMPNLQLTESQIDALVAYLRTLE